MLTQFRNFQFALQWRLFIASKLLCVSTIQQRRYSCSAVDGYLQFCSPRETILSLLMVIKAIGLSFNPSNLMDPPVHGSANAFFSLLPLPSVLIPHQVRLSLRKELLGLVLGTSLNHRPTLRVMYAPASSHCPWFLPALEKLPRSLMCT